MVTEYSSNIVRKLASIARLTSEEEEAAARLPVSVVDLRPHQDFIREGDRPHRSALVVEGFVVSSKVVTGGNRQITSFYIPGDMPDLQSLHLAIMDFNLTAIVPSKVALIEHQVLRRLCFDHPRLCFALWRMTLIDAAIYREWVVNTGQRPALARTAHIFCELLMRFQAVGLAEDRFFDFPLTQAELADTLGLSAVHVNRVLQELRSEGLIELRDKRLYIRQWDRLCEVADFDPTYLHLQEKDG
ncbi:MAG: helix-turn-helix protein [Xanthobacteraceae bacterium]|jgi:CRP-like cAMP-binding protein|nr:helix-turn-helix protein [Xanthobacteraceae bacterium]